MRACRFMPMWPGCSPMSKKTAGTALKPVRVGAILALVVAGLLAIVYWTAPEQTGRVVAVVTPQFDVMRIQPADIPLSLHSQGVRSEERRVGKECSARWSPYHENNNHW